MATATDLFNDATTRSVGGVGPDQVDKIVADLTGVQQMLSAADPNINNLSDLHTHVIINQLNEEIASVQGANAPLDTPILGTDLGQFVGRAINDIHRDIIDIAQGDPGVQANFNPTPLPPLNEPPTPFQDNAAQTAFLTKFILDSNHFGQMATTIENNGFQGDTAGLIQQIQTYENNANAFDQSQGGLYSARFWNEYRADGTAGTAANALIEGLQTHNTGEIDAAVQQLSTNAADLATNNVPVGGGDYAAIVAAAQAPAMAGNGGGGAGAGAGGGAGGNAGAGAGAGDGDEVGAGAVAGAQGGGGGNAGGAAAAAGAPAGGNGDGDEPATAGGATAGATGNGAGDHGAQHGHMGHDVAQDHTAAHSPLADMAQHMHHIWA
jgi:trimeric autotransporter adhesin